MQIDNTRRRHSHRVVKWRNQLLALFCLIIFAGLGVLYFQHWVIQKPFGIILFVGQGLSPSRLAPTRLYIGGADARLTLDGLPHLALIRNHSKDFATPDQAAAATAIATGVKVNNRLIAVDADGRHLATILEKARGQGRAIGLVTDAKLTNPTSAAFYAHSSTPNEADAIAASLIDAKLDVAMGGGLAQLLPADKGGERQDGRDLVLELRRNGFEVVQTRAELEAIPAWKKSKIVGLFSRGEFAFTNEVEARAQQPSLSDMTRRAIELLQYNTGGYVLVVDAGLMRNAALENNAERTLGETAELDRAVAVARRYAGEKSTILVCGDVAIGGMHLNGFPFRTDSGIAVLGLNSAGQPWITWAAGPNGIQSYGASRIPSEAPNEQGSPEQLEPGAFYTKWAVPTVEDTIVFGGGRGADALHGVIDNTAIFQILNDQL